MSLTFFPKDIDQGLVLEFFWKFSIFEYALKREGYLRSGRNRGAEPDWIKFGHDIRGKFDQVTTPEIKLAKDLLIKLSPQRQIVHDMELGWEPVVRQEEDSDEEFTLRILRTSRNNLFHGGKYPESSIREIARDREILKASLAILQGCYEIHTGIKSRIDEVISNFL
ncbi:hypothetical protein EOM60_06020 [Candidatus Saccharibacteria bacterium]|nr:hypothetical protein [Candidatus Saccharibacteria bacterium]